MPQSMFTEVFVLDSADRAVAGTPEHESRAAEPHANAGAVPHADGDAADSVFSVRIRPRCAMRFVKGGRLALHKALGQLLGADGADHYRTQIERVLMDQVQVLQDCPGIDADNRDDAHGAQAVSSTRDITMTPFNDADGSLAGVVVCTRTKPMTGDNTSKSASNNTINNASSTPASKNTKDSIEGAPNKKQAEIASPELLKQQLLAVISHELRSPLAGIRSWSHVLERSLKSDTHEGLSAPVRRAIQGVVAGVDRQVAVVDCLIDSARVLSGDVKLHCTEFALNRAVDSALAKLAGDITERHLTVERAEIKHFAGLPNLQTPSNALTGAGDDSYKHADTNDWQTVSGDFDRITQAVHQLLLNAVKFSSEAAVIRITMEGHAQASGVPTSNGVRLSIENSGQAIPQAALAQIFAPFDQADQSAHRQHDGLGLGLSVARRLIELHGGAIAAENLAPNGGAGVRFCLVLPQVFPSNPPAANDIRGYDVETNTGCEESSAAKFACLTGLSVMVVDDQEEARESLTAMLEQSGASVVPMASGLQAVSQLEATGASHEPDVLICDIAMPGQDGYTTLQCIRAWEAECGLVPGTRMAAIALTAFAQEEDRQRAFASGYEAHFAKPVDPAQLLVAIANLAEKAA